MSQKMKTILKSVLVLASFALSFQASAVWLAPTASPTGNNAEPPVNVSSVLQYKEGSLVVGGFKSYATVFDGPVEINRTSTNSGLRLNTITSGNPFIDFTQDSTLKANLFWNRSQNRFVINNIGTNTTINEGSGSVGIGTATPGAKLEVAGQVKITGGTPGAGKVLTSDANGLATWETSTSSLSGSGITNYVTKWTGTGSTIGNSTIYDNGTNVGVRTMTPTNLLTLHQLSNTTAATQGTYGLAIDTPLEPQRLTLGADATYAYIQSWSGKPLYINSQGNNVLFGSGSVGIGTATPGAKLEVAGQVKITGGTPGAGKVLTSDANGLATWETSTSSLSGSGTTNYVTKWTGTGSTIGNSTIYDNGTNVGVRTMTPTNLLTLHQLSNTTAATQGTYGLAIDTPLEPQRLTLGADATYAYIQSWSGKPLYINSQGNNVLFGSGSVGIGTATPLSKLFVAGGIYNANSGANNAAYALGAQSIAANDSIYSYGAICAGNANGNCSGSGGTVITSSGITTAGNILATGTFGSGWTEPNLGAGPRMMWYPRKSAFRVGYVEGTEWDNTNIGNHSIAMGYNTTARGVTSTAMGLGTVADSYESFALGRYNVGGGNSTSWVATDPLFEIGMGTGSSTRLNALTVFKNGNAKIAGTVDSRGLSFSNLPTATVSGSIQGFQDSKCLDFGVTGIPVRYTVAGGGGNTEETHFKLYSSIDSGNPVNTYSDGLFYAEVINSGENIYGTPTRIYGSAEFTRTLPTIKVCGTGIEGKNFIDLMTITYIPLSVQ